MAIINTYNTNVSNDNVEEVTCIDEPAENDQMNLQLYGAL